MTLRHVVAGLGVCLIAVAPAFGQTSLAEKSGVNAVIDASPSTHDFVTEAAIGDMFEIQSSRMAQQKSSDAATKAFAAQMISDHQKTTDELTALTHTKGVNVTPPATLDASHREKLADLGKLSGADFTKRYRSDQVSAHEAAVSAFRRYAQSGDNPALKDWAGKTIPTLQHHLQMAQDLDRQVSSAPK
jgi:putative membrane protein